MLKDHNPKGKDSFILTVSTVCDTLFHKHLKPTAVKKWVRLSVGKNLLHKQKTKQIPWPLVHKRTIPTEQPPLVSEFWCQFLRIEGCCVISTTEPPQQLILVF
jgi:hypothetical protein